LTRILILGLAPNVGKLAVSVDVQFWPIVIVPHSVHFHFQYGASCTSMITKSKSET